MQMLEEFEQTPEKNTTAVFASNQLLLTSKSKRKFKQRELSMDDNLRDVSESSGIPKSKKIRLQNKKEIENDHHNSDINLIKPTQKQKSRYPKIKHTTMTPTFERKHSSGDVLQKLLEDICQLEAQELRIHFDSVVDCVGKSEILNDMIQILTQLPSEITKSGCFQKISFQPEYSSMELRSLNTIRELKIALTNQSNQLTQYINGMDSFMAEYHLESGENVIRNDQESSIIQSNSSFHVQKTNYEFILQEFDNFSNHLGMNLDESKINLKEAKEIQESLYKTFNQIRMKELLTKSNNNQAINNQIKPSDEESSSKPQDAKQLIQGLTKLL